MLFSKHLPVKQTVVINGYLRVSAITIFIWILVMGYVLRHSKFGPIPFHGVAAAHQSLYPQNRLFWAIFTNSSNSSFFMLWMWFLACNHHQDMWLEPYTWIFEIGKFLFIKVICVWKSYFWKAKWGARLRFQSFWPLWIPFTQADILDPKLGCIEQLCISKNFKIPKFELILRIRLIRAPPGDQIYVSSYVSHQKIRCLDTKISWKFQPSPKLHHLKVLSKSLDLQNL